MQTRWQRFWWATAMGSELRLLPWRVRWFFKQLWRTFVA
jgi:hypothetical protein